MTLLQTPLELCGPLTDSVPGRFEALLDRAPGEPAVVLHRDGRRARVWPRAAVEHRGVVLGALLAERFDRGAPIGVSVAGALDAMSALYFVLASGRVLTPVHEAAHVIDDELLALAALRERRYSLACAVVGLDPAARVGGVDIDHAELLRRAMPAHTAALGAFHPLLARALHALATGLPLEVDGKALSAVRTPAVRAA